MKSVHVMMIPALAAFATTPLFADGGAQHQTKQNPPVKMGTSGGSANDISHFYCCSGTLGSLVMRDGVLNILSNNHVLARSGSATAGEDTIQPGFVDTGCSLANVNIVGDFGGNIVPLGSANVDVGLSVARSNVDASGAILDIGVPKTGIQAGTIGLPVMKSGRTTGFTTGSITSINTNVSIQYQKGCNAGKKFTVTFVNQLVTGPMSAGGDSGSLLISNDGSPNPVGLLFAGSSSVTIYNPIQDVVNALSAGGHSVSFVGTASPDGGDQNALPLSPSDEDLRFALEAKVENADELMRNPAVLGVGVGANEKNPREAVIVIYADQSAPYNFPLVIDGFGVRVIPTETIVAQ